MLLVFVDETGDSKFKEYLGISVAMVNATFYPALKRSAQELLLDFGWELAEFKGAHLFSQTKGCVGVDVETRIELAKALLDLHTANNNRRMRFAYSRMESVDHRADYLRYLPGLLEKALPKASRKSGKDLLFLCCDRRSDVTAAEIFHEVEPSISAKGYALLENVMTAESSFETIGLLYADLVGYLSGRIDTITSDLELYDDVSEQNLAKNGKLRKLLAAQEIIERLKKLQQLRVRR